MCFKLLPTGLSEVSTWRTSSWSAMFSACFRFSESVNGGVGRIAGHASGGWIRTGVMFDDSSTLYVVT